MRIPILGYHKVGPVAELGRRLNIEVPRLRSHVRFFHRRGFGFVTVRELAERWPRRSIAFTFDDAFRGAVEDGLPLFDAVGARATVYAVTDLVGGVAAWEGESPYPLADWAALKAAEARGHEVSNHTGSHPRLAQISREAQAEEIERARLALAERGFSAGSFCLPYGSYGPETIEILRHKGYQTCVTVRKGVAAETDTRLELPRIFVAYSDTLPMLLYRIYVRPLLR